jgi:hypothetical protein
MEKTSRGEIRQGLRGGEVKAKGKEREETSRMRGIGPRR